MKTPDSTAVSRSALVAKIAVNDKAMIDLQAEIDRSYSMLGCTGMHQWRYERLDGMHTHGINLRDELRELDAAAAAAPKPAMVPQQAQLQQADASKAAGGPACEACGRPLSDPFSIKAGLGPVCRAAGHVSRRRLHLWELLGGADYETEVVDGIICIVDLDRGGPSVTNSAVAVVADLVYQCYDLTQPVIYRDSTGTWDEMIVRGGRFVGFAPIDKKHRCEALAVIAQRRIAAKPVRLVCATELIADGAAAFARIETDQDVGVSTLPRA